MGELKRQDVLVIFILKNALLHLLGIRFDEVTRLHHIKVNEFGHFFNVAVVVCRLGKKVHVERDFSFFWCVDFQFVASAGNIRC